MGRFYKKQQKQKTEVKQVSEEELHLSQIIEEDIDAMVELRMRAERNVDPHQRIIERVTQNIGRPRFLYCIILFVFAWVVINSFAGMFGITFRDTPPFSWLQGFISFSALIVTTVVLITQNRQDKLAEQRRHLDLQINLIVERKVSKVIELVEELRRDMPIVRDRFDPQAEAMQENVDPHEVLSSLNDSLDEAIKELDLP
jgi:uncharacterized membrane protein